MPRRQFMQAAALGAAGFSLTAPALAADSATASTKGRIKQSFTWGAFQKKDITPERLIKEAAAIGYKSIEMGPEEHWGKIRDAGMAVAIFVGHGSLEDGMNDRRNHDRIEKELLRNLDLAERNKIPSILCLSGNRRGKSEAEGLANTVDGFKRVIRAAEEKKITLCLELLNSRVDHPDYQCDRVAWGVEVCKGVNSPAMKLLYDIYHMQIMEGDLIRSIRNNIQFIGHFHTAGNPGRRDPDETQEIYYPPVMKAIAESGYAGYVGHEFGPKGDPIEALRKAFQICDV